MNLTTKPEKLNASNRRDLRVRAFGNLDGWVFFIHSAVDRLLLSRDFGQLPSDYQHWNQHSATLYSLAQAQRYIAKHFPDSRVVMICTIAPALQMKRRRAA
jgi:hypothetical protein